MTGHSRHLLAGFNDGKACFVYARDRRDPDGPAYFLDHGSVTDEVRELTRAHLECPMPDCADRRIIAVNRSNARRRDGFRHHGGSGGHEPESEFHFQSKLMIARWAESAYPGCSAQVEQSTDDRSRRADVMITFPGGDQLAVEVQYAALPIEQWRERNNSYLSQGIPCVWLLGHRPPHLHSRGGNPTITLTALQTAMAGDGAPLLWVHPDGWLGTVTLTRGRFQVPPSDDPRQVCVFAADPIAECTLTPTGISTPTLMRAHAAQQELDAVNARLAAEAAQREAARQAEAAALAARTEYARRMQEKQHEEWMNSELRQRIIDRYGHIPEPIAARLTRTAGVYADPEMWHAVICRDLLHGKAGATFTIADVYRTLGHANIELHKDSGKRGAAIVDYLDELDRQGLLRLTRDPKATWRVTGCTVIQDLDQFEERRAKAERTEARRVERQERAAVLVARIDAREREREATRPASDLVPSGAELQTTTEVTPHSQPVHPSSSQPQWLSCRVCGRRLDPILKTTRQHVYC